MAENPNDFVDYATLAWRTADVAQKAGLFGWLKQRVAREPQDSHDWQAEAIEALRLNAVDRFRSATLTMEQAIRILGPEFGPDDLKELDSSWEHHWIAGAGKVAADDEERRGWWARILAGEIRQPGSFLFGRWPQWMCCLRQRRAFSRSSLRTFGRDPRAHIP